MTEAKLLDQRATRSCGACQACCVVLGVKPIEKQPYHRCEHQSAKGCGIYETRPDPCKLYRCGWLEGLGERRDRPDRLGIIIDRIAPAEAVQARAAAGEAHAVAQVASASKTVRAREVGRGALAEPRAKRLVEALHRAGMLVVLVPFAGRKLPVGRPLEDAR